MFSPNAFLSLIIIFLFLIVSFPPVYADRVVGNGGDAIVYKTESGLIEKVEFYDVYENRVRRNFHAKLGDENLGIDEKFEIVLKRINKFNPNRAALYRNWYESFIEETDFVKGVELIDIPDTGIGNIPSGSELRQIAQQRYIFLPGEKKRYIIDNLLWNYLDNTNKASLIFHELLLREASTCKIYSHNSSMYVRYYLGHIISDTLLNYSLKDYIHLMRDSFFPITDSHGSIPIMLFDKNREYEIQFYHKNNIKSAYVSNLPFKYTIFEQSVTINPPQEEYFRNIDFFENGQVKSLYSRDLPNSITELELYSKRGTIATYCTGGCNFEFYENGALKTQYFPKSYKINSPFFFGQGRSPQNIVDLLKYGEPAITFYESGVPKIVNLSGTLLFEGKEIKTLRFILTEDGDIDSFLPYHDL